MWGYYPSGVPHTLKLLCVLQVGYLARSACQISASYLYASCSYANKCISYRLRHILCFHYVPQIVRGFEGEDVKILCSNPEKALPCVNTRLLVYRMSKSVQLPEL